MILLTRAADKLLEISAVVSDYKELKLIRDNQKGLGVRLKKLEDNQKTLISLVSSLMKATFAIKGSEYKVSCIT